MAKATKTASKSKSVNLFAANHQWSTRPADERFWTLSEAQESCRHYAETARESPIDVNAAPMVYDEEGNLAFEVGGDRPAVLTHWAFGQVARLAGAPADYLRQLPVALARECIAAGIAKTGEGQPKNLKALVHSNGRSILRAVTSEQYARVWNHEVFERLVALEGAGWKVPPARPCGTDDPRSRKATKADISTRAANGGGVAVREGDTIAPAGVYASDHDMFAFLVNERYTIDDGSDGGLARGIFVSNSEVGAGALRVTCFYYRSVCGNHIVWGAKDIVEVKVRHVGQAMPRFVAEVTGQLDAYLSAGTAADRAVVARAKTVELGGDVESVLDRIFQIARRPSGMNTKHLAEAHQIAIEHEDTDGNPYSVWGMVNGLTRLSQRIPYADERTLLDRFAGKLLSTTAA
jgi:hypothetical protein